jgi:hypothetical protein
MTLRAIRFTISINGLAALSQVLRSSCAMRTAHEVLTLALTAKSNTAARPTAFISSAAPTTNLLGRHFLWVALKPYACGCVRFPIDKVTETVARSIVAKARYAGGLVHGQRIKRWPPFVIAPFGNVRKVLADISRKMGGTPAS